MNSFRLLKFLIWTIPCSFAFILVSAPNAPSKSLSITSGHVEAKQSPKVVVIGSGWAGFSAADALSTVEDGLTVEVELLDASPRGQGGLAGGWRTSKLERPVEAGLHGFWREYRNTFATLERIDGINIDEVLTPFTPSILVSESGRVAVAPVLGSVMEDHLTPPSLPNLDWTDPAQVMKYLADLLPPPLDVAVLAEFPPESPLTVTDRISALGMLGAWADFGQEDDESWARYDRISAENLFCASARVTPALYRELVSPLLHVLPMTPGYDCSAAAALSCFHVFALQSRGAFDVRWCRGTISERIFNPWASQLQARGNVKIRGSSKVTSVAAKNGGYELVINNNETLECDAVVLAVGGTALKHLLPSCQPLQQLPASQKFYKLRGITCVAVRMFLRPDAVTTTGLEGGMYDSTQLPPCVAQAMHASPVVVCGPRIGGLPQLAETGFCIYDLQRLHDEFAVVNQGNHEKDPCAAIEVDFFRADTITDMESDAEVSKLALRAVGAALNVNALDPSLLLDVAVVRAKDAVSHFCVDSASASPGVRMTKGIYMCGDWIDRAGHASWSTEKAVVTGRQAAHELAKDFGLQSNIEVLPAAPDSPQLSALRQAAKAMRGVLSPLLGHDMLPVSLWVVARQIMLWGL
jgi:uncharacterized protein with NAD-binding domain and iron-sulfur cluster